ncbi:MAG TPA: glycosyltransferase family 4 protein [Chryseolinea sp.]|nr:glycosyltransferase family 4 protein [Chryseolinea sp.]
MKIVILTQYFLPEMGAPQNRLFDMAKGLINLECEVKVVAAMPNYPTGRIFASHKNKFSQTDSIDGIEVKRFWLYPSNAPKALPRIVSMLSFSFTSLFSIFYIRKTRPDYILVESPPLTLAFSAWILAILSRSKLIINVSDLWPLSAKELGAIGDGTLYNMLERLERFLYRKAFICTGQSQEIVDYIAKTNSDKTYLFRNGVDTKRFINAEYNPSKRNHIVYAGLLGVAQGILSICENIDFKELNTEFHIYGTGTEQDKILAFLKENPLRGITYHGTLKRDEMPEVLSSYGGTMIPLIKNIYGAVPSKIYEAMAAGLPIIFSGEGEGAAIIKKSNAGWISNPKDWTTLKGCISEFLNMPNADYVNTRERNMKTAHQYFDRNKQIIELNSFLRARMNP